MYKFLETIFSLGFVASLGATFGFYAKEDYLRCFACIGICCVCAMIASFCKPRMIRRNGNGNTFNEYTAPQVKSPYISPIEEERIRRITAIAVKENNRINRKN